MVVGRYIPKTNQRFILLKLWYRFSISFHSRLNGVEKFVDEKKGNLHIIITYILPVKNYTFWLLVETLRNFLAKPSRAKIQSKWIIQFVTLIETMGSVAFTWELFEVARATRPIAILRIG